MLSDLQKSCKQGSIWLKYNSPVLIDDKLLGLHNCHRKPMPVHERNLQVKDYMSKKFQKLYELSTHFITKTNRLNHCVLRVSKKQGEGKVKTETQRYRVIRALYRLISLRMREGKLFEIIEAASRLSFWCKMSFCILCMVDSTLLRS